MSKRLVVGFVASVVSVAGGVLWPTVPGILLTGIGVVTNGMLISAMSAATTRSEWLERRLESLVMEFYDQGKEARNFRAAAVRLNTVLKGGE